jgi:hypothetical protein
MEWRVTEGDMQTGNGVLETIMLWGGVALTWAAGESGRVIVASGMGGFVRWLASEQKRIRDGVLAVTGGAIAGTYLWPGVLAATSLVGLPLEHSPNNIALAAFVTGTIGISFVKIIAAVVEARTKAWSGE